MSRIMSRKTKRLINLNVYFRIMIVFICFTAVLCVNTIDSEAKSNDNLNEYTTVCEEALRTIQAINQDNLKVYIGDLYNVIDTDGNLDGYSLGYFVDDVPYGYAIYSLSDKSIREFVFQSGVKNIYEELEEKAEKSDNVNEDELIDGVVYDGGIGYSTYDFDGNKVEINDISYNYNEEEPSNDEDVEEILSSNYVKPNSIYSGNFNSLVNSINYWDIYDSATFDSWDIVPDCGLVMITYDYAKDIIKKYGCTIQSATGLLNWMGRLRGSIADTYNEIWNNVNVKIENADDPNAQWLYGGAFLEDVKNYFNSYFMSLGIKTRAYMDQDVTFNDVINHIGSNNSGEKAPFSMSIWIDGQGGHTVTVISYLKTSSKKYVGIYNGWGFDENDSQVDNNGLKSNVNNDTSYLSVRYIDFEDLKNRSNISSEGMMFKDVQSANIKEANTQYASGNNIEMACYVPNGTKYVYFPTWTAASNGTGVVWHKGNIQYGNVATVSIDLNTYNKVSGNYATHIYAYDGNMNQLACYGTVYNNIDSTISNVKVTNKTIKGYTLTCDLPTGTSRVVFPTWSNVNGQDDIIWYEGNIISNNGKKQGKITIDVANHKNDGGIYITHIYAYDKYNNMIVCNGSGGAVITDRKQLTDVKVTSVTSNSYKVTCKIPTGTSYVRFPTWTSNNGQDDIIWYNANISGETASLTIYKSKHNNETGIYNTHIYAYNSKNQLINSASASVNLK